MSLRNQPKIYEANRRPKGRHLLFCFISFIGIYYPLTNIVIVHIVCNPSDPLLPLTSIPKPSPSDHPSAHPSVYPSDNVAKLKTISLKRANHLLPPFSARTQTLYSPLHPS